MTDSLTAPERETVILLNDADEWAEVSTHQRPMLTKLERNPAAEKIEDLTFGSTAGARFRIPAKLVSVRKRTTLSVEEKARRAERLNATRTP